MLEWPCQYVHLRNVAPHGDDHPGELVPWGEGQAEIVLGVVPSARVVGVAWSGFL